MRQTLSTPILLLLLMFSMTPFATAFQIDRLVDIPDPVLRATIAAGLGKNAGDTITEADMLTLHTLSFSPESEATPITDLTGLASAENLTELQLGGNNISDVSPLAGLTKLTELQLSNNNISDVSPLVGLTKMTELQLSNNNISDISFLAGLTKMTRLTLDGNNISDISFLAGLTKMTWLTLRYNNISDVSPLVGLKNLTGLALVGINVSDISFLAGLTKMTYLSLHENNISDVSPLAELKNLTDLSLSYNNISDVSPLARLTKLRYLYLRYNNISDISPLARLTKLTHLLLRGNDISDVSPLAGLTKLTELTLDGNNISDISFLTGLTKMTWLALSNNNISDISFLAGLTSLTRLWLFENNISDISPLARLTKLTHLWLFENNISDISPLAGLTKLTKLYLSNNRISDFSPIARLIPNLEVYQYGNQQVRNATVGLSPASVASPAVGQHLTFSLNITGGENIAGYQAIVNFDRGTLQYVESANSDYLPSGAFFIPPIAEVNTVLLAATSLSGESDGDGTLATLTFKVVAVKPSTVRLTDVLLTDSSGGSSVPQVENAEITEPPQLPADVNGDGVVNIIDLTLVASNFGKTGQNAADVNGDKVVNIIDLTLVAAAFGNTAAGPERWALPLNALTTRAQVEQWLQEARRMNAADPTFQHGILVLEQLLVALTPKETFLLPNYPNPFNPETWIPYHLAEPAEVSISVHAADGKLVRKLKLGLQDIGIYESRSRAAYWDGRNNIGEPVASGLYFYTLTAGDFATTRKMLIRK